MGAETFLGGGVLAGALVVAVIAGITVTIGQDRYTLVSNEKIYYGHDNPQNIKVGQLFGSTGTGEELMVVGHKDGETFPIASTKLNSISVGTDNEFYLQKITRHIDRGWFNFANTTYEWNLVLPKNLTLEIE